jgi:hypothetical protein
LLSLERGRPPHNEFKRGLEIPSIIRLEYAIGKLYERNGFSFNDRLLVAL